MLDLKALLTKIVVGVNNHNASLSGLGAKTFLDAYYKTSYSSALANSYQFKSFMAAQYNHQYRSTPVNVYSVRAVQNQASPSSGLYAYNLLMFEYEEVIGEGSSHSSGIIFITGVLNHSHSSVTNTIVGYQPSGSAYCDREKIVIPLSNTNNIASKVYNSNVAVAFVATNMFAPWINPYITKNSATDVTLDITSIMRMKAQTAENAFSAIIVYW